MRSATDPKYDALKLNRQLCFPLYAAAKEVVRRCTPYLEPLGLTYTQYIVMLVLWEHGSLGFRELSAFLYLDSGTLTPLLKKLENRGFLTRRRSREDERTLIVSLTPEGEALKEQALPIPGEMADCVHLSPEEAAELYGLLHKVLGPAPEQS